MEINTQTETATPGVEFWENEIAYLENAKEGLKASYAIVSQMLQNAQNRLSELEDAPTRDEVEKTWLNLGNEKEEVING